MASPYGPRRRVTQPGQTVGVNWENPITTGLMALTVGASKLNLITGKLGVTSGAGGYTFAAPGRSGIARTFTRGSAAQELHIATGHTGDVTIFLVGGITTTLASSQYVLALQSGASTARVVLGENSNNSLTFITTPNGGSTITAAAGGSGDAIYIGVLSGTTMTFYKNGTQISTAVQSGNNWSDCDRFCVGNTAFLSNPNANVYLAGYARRAWSVSEVLAFSANPWMLLKASPRFFFDQVVGGLQSLTVTPTGGWVFGGTSPIIRGAIKTPAGGYIFGGSSPSLRGVIRAVSGGFTFGGATTQLRGIIRAVSGGYVFGGASTVVLSPDPNAGTIKHNIKRHNRRSRTRINF